MPSCKYRMERFGAILQIGLKFGTGVKFCGFKNPDITELPLGTSEGIILLR